MKFFLRKYLKAPIALLVCLVLVLQMLPAPQPAQASFWDIVKKVISKISLPNEVELTNKGEIRMGSAGDDIFKTNSIGIDNLFDWLFKDIEPAGGWVTRDIPARNINPFSKITIGGDSSRPLIDATTGRPNISQPDIPEECELRIKRPGDELSDLSEEESLAHREACTHFIRLQQSAAEEVWVAKKIFNNTNPYDDCFFLKNCRSKCYLSYGELKYVITWLDIAQFLLPTSWITVIKKIMGVIAALKEIEKAYTALKALLTDGIALVNNFFATFHYLVNMFQALDNIGGTMSAAIGVAGVIGSGLESAGVLQIPGNALQYGTVVAGAAVLTSNKGINSMTDMLKRFSDNLLRYSAAKSETNAYIMGIRRDLTAVLEGDANIPSKGAKHEQELAFFFEPNNEVKKNLDKIVGNFQMSFKQLSSLLDNAVMPGRLPEGPVSELPPQGEDSNAYYVRDAKGDFVLENGRPKVAAFVLQFGKESEDGSGGIIITNTTFSTSSESVQWIHNKANFCQSDCAGDNCKVCIFDGDRIIPWSGATCPIDKVLPENIEQLRKLTEPNHIKEILAQALDGACPYKTPEMALSDLPNCCLSLSNSYNNSYCYERLKNGNDWKQPWVDYWIELRRVTLSDDDSDPRFDTMSEIQTEIMKIEKYKFLGPIIELSNKNGLGSQNKNAGIDNYAKTGALSNTEMYIDNVYAPQRLRKAGFFNFCDPAKVGGTANRPVTWLDNFKTIFQEASVLQADFGLVDPQYIEDMLIGEGTSIMACASQKGACNLDQGVSGWWAYWENLYRAYYGDEAARALNSSDKLMKDKHKERVSAVFIKNPLLGYIARIEFGTKFYPQFKALDGKSFDGIRERDRGYYNVHCDSALGDDGIKDDETGTYCFIKRRINEYRAARKATLKAGSGGAYAETVNGKISAILEYVNALSSQKDYLEDRARRRDPTPEREKRYSGGSNYWQSQLWCADNCGSENSGKFAGTYDPDLAKYDWDSRVAAMVNSADNFKAVANALSMGVSPQDPAIIYTIATTSAQFAEAINKANASSTDFYLKRQRDCVLYDGYLYRQLGFAKGDNYSNCGDCPCSIRACLRWTNDSTDGHDWCSAAPEPNAWPSCQGQICKCCSNENDCRNKKDNLVASVQPRCRIEVAYPPYPTFPINISVRERQAILNAYYNSAAYLAAKAQDDRLNVPYNKEWNILTGLFYTWQWNFGGNVLDENNPDYYKKKYGFQKLQEIQDLIMALQIVWQGDLTFQWNKNVRKDSDDMTRLLNKLCLDGQWVNDPSPRCTGTPLISDYNFRLVKDAWATVRHTSLATSSDSGTGAAKNYAASIVTSKIISQEIDYRVQALKYIFEGYPNSTPANSPIILRAQIAALDYLPSSQRDELLEIVDDFEKYYNKIKEEVVDYLDKTIGQYVYPYGITNHLDVCPDNIDEKGFLNRIACFEWCGGLPLEACIKPAAVSQVKRFEDFMLPLSGIENIEDSLFMLTEAKEETDKVSSIQESVGNLKPEIKSEAIALNTGLIQDFENKLTNPVKKLINKYNPFKDEGVDENSSETVDSDSGIFKGGDDGKSTWKDFVKALVDSPLAFLEDQFTNIKDTSDTIKTKLGDAGSWLPNFFGGDRYTQYYTNLNNVKDVKMDDLGVLVFGNNEIKSACSALGILLNGDLATMDKTCSQKADGGELNSAWLLANDNQPMLNKCESWLELAVDIADPVELQARRTTLQNLRNCLGANCIKCPLWFCADPATGAWGVGAMQKDPFCVNKCANWQPNQSTGYVCDRDHNIVWNTADFGPPVSNIPTETICQDLEFTPSPLCTVTKVNDRCQLIGNFLRVSSCDLFTTCTKEELQKQLDIKKWRDQSAANKCPKWLCLNESGLLNPLANDANEDVYCKQIRNGGPFTGDNQANFDKPGDGFYYRNRIIWDTATNPTVASQVWSGAAAVNAKCAEAQQGLLALGLGPLDPPPPASPCSPIQPIIPFCQHKITCEKMKQACSAWSAQKTQANSPANTNKPSMEWPPTKPPLVGGYTQGYQGVQKMCIQTQRQMTLLDSIREATGDEIALMKLTDDCSELTRQKQLKAECDKYDLTKYAIQNKCGQSKDGSACGAIRKDMSSICTVKDKNGNKAFRDDKYCNGDNIKDIISVSANPDITKKNTEAIKKLRGFCIEANDIRTPLDEVMKVLSVLMGIQSGTAAQGGITTSIKGSKAFYENAGKFIKMIEGLKKAMGAAYDNEMKKNAASSGGLKITPFKCVAAPAESYAGGKKQPLTGPKGGPVCPEVAGLYSQLQNHFSQIRQQLHEIDKVYHKARDTNIPLPWNDAYLHLWTSYEDAYPSIKPMYDRAEELKQSAQFVWALATALNFASTNCTCGMSYCKIPFCISGLPLTLAPLTDPYCALVWMMRTPMVNMAEKLEKDLNKPLE